jgi:hypothetical protein
MTRSQAVSWNKELERRTDHARSDKLVETAWTAAFCRPLLAKAARRRPDPVP